MSTQLCDLYIGSYAPVEAPGIQHFKFDGSDGSIVAHSSLRGIKDPSFLALGPDGRSLLTVSEGAGAVAQVLRDPASGALSLGSQAPTHGDWPCHVSVDASGRMALVTNYGSGSLLAYPLPISTHNALIQHVGSGPFGDRQTHAHAHSAVMAPDGKHAVVCDLGCDMVFVYALDPANASVQQVQALPSTPGAGPRHSVFHPSGRHLYVINELDSTVVTYAWQKNQLRALDVARTLPGDFTGESWCAEVCVSPNGRFVYGSNRGHNSIAILRVEADGTLVPHAHESTRGNWPRHFAISPDGGWLLCANQRSGDVQVFAVGSDGLLHYSGRSIQMPGASSVLFVQKEDLARAR